MRNGISQKIYFLKFQDKKWYICDHLPGMQLQFIDTPSLAKSYFPCYLLDGAIISTGVSLKVVQNPLPYR